MAKKQPLTPIESIFGMSPARATELLGMLTERERQALELMATGMKNGKIAEQLGISPKTLDIHRAHIRQKLENRTAIGVVQVVYAAKLGEFLK